MMNPLTSRQLLLMAFTLLVLVIPADVRVDSMTWTQASVTMALYSPI